MVVQPYLHDLVCVLAAPIQVWSEDDGNLARHGAQGIYCGDTRAVSEVILTVDSHQGASVHSHVSGSSAEFSWVLRTPSEGADPLLTLARERTVSNGAVVETITIHSAATQTQRVVMSLLVRPDASDMSAIKAGRESAPSGPPKVASATWLWRDDAARATFESDGKVSIEDGCLAARWEVMVEPGARRRVHWTVRLDDDSAIFRRPSDPGIDCPPSHRGDLDRLMRHSVADLRGLCLAEITDSASFFVAAGAPWYLTLFGRDALMTALMMAQANPALAVGTLTTLAARQGVRIDIDAAEQPGKILHEVRRDALDMHEGTLLPPHYYGTIDATPLWIMLLRQVANHVSARALEHLIDPLLAALSWLRDFADSDGDGLLEYFDDSGHGLTNQGWKDSGDAIRSAEGAIAEGPIALIEVQGYAFAAARAAAWLLPRLGRTERERSQAGFWELWAADLAARVRDQFWIEDELGSYLAMALDARKRPVSGVASNMGHLLGLGILTPPEERLVVDRLMHPSMFSGYGIRTLSTTNGAYWPLRYHGGSVWTHDTAWIAAGMHRAGFVTEAATIAEGLLRAAAGFNDRLPELFSGRPAAEVFPPPPYPSSCRPQAWAAASAFVLHDILTP